MAKEPESTEPIKLTIVSEKSENHVSFVSNKVWGGLQPGGLFEFNFMQETKRIPEKMTILVNPDGTEKELSRNKNEEIVRKNMATCHMNFETLIAFHTWLTEKLDEFEKKGLITKTEE